MSFFACFEAFVRKSDISGPEIKIFYHNLGFCAFAYAFLWTFGLFCFFMGVVDDCVLVKL